MIVLGLDLATHTSGWCIMNDKYEVIDKGLIYSEGSEVRERIKNIYFQVSDIIDKYIPEVVILEDVPINPYVNIRVGKDLSILHGAILGLCFQKNLKYLKYSPTEWRSQAGTYDGTRAGMKRDAQKAKAIELVNESYKELNIDSDDIAESILISKVGVKNLIGG